MEFSTSQHKTERSKIKTQSGYNANNSKKNKRKERRPPKRITPAYLHNSGIYYLERFVASKNHFKSVMARKAKRSCLYHTEQDYDECLKMIDETADKFEDMGLLNDVLYTNGMVHSLRKRGLSRHAIVQKMRIKGIDRDKTIEALNTLDYSNHDMHHDTDHDVKKMAEIAAALRLARKKKMGPYRIEKKSVNEDEKVKELNRHMGRFARAGFSYDITKLVLDMSIDDTETYKPYF